MPQIGLCQVWELFVSSLMAQEKAEFPHPNQVRDCGEGKGGRCLGL